VAIERNERKVARSEDGVTWEETAEKLPGGIQGLWSAVAYGNGKFIVLSNNSDIAYSADDGVSWTKKAGEIPAGNGRIAYGNRRFVAVFDANPGHDKAAWSEDGVTWEEAVLPRQARWSGVAYGGGTFVAIADTAEGYAAWSEDGENWVGAALPELQEGARWAAIAFMEGY
jgi:hypothetical protein